MTVDEALDTLLGPAREGDPTTQLEEALRESLRRRERNSEAGGAIVHGLLRSGWSYREIERRCGLPVGTAHRWALKVGSE